MARRKRKRKRKMLHPVQTKSRREERNQKVKAVEIKAVVPRATGKTQNSKLLQQNLRKFVPDLDGVNVHCPQMV